jgi:hypothetical protein
MGLKSLTTSTHHLAYYLVLSLKDLAHNMQPQTGLSE